MTKTGTFNRSLWSRLFKARNSLLGGGVQNLAEIHYAEPASGDNPTFTEELAQSFSSKRSKRLFTRVSLRLIMECTSPRHSSQIPFDLVHIQAIRNLAEIHEDDAASGHKPAFTENLHAGVRVSANVTQEVTTRKACPPGGPPRFSNRRIRLATAFMG
jgi:hypothetical protein